MRRFYLLSAMLVAQMFCFVGESYSVSTEDLSEQSGTGKNILKLADNGY